MYQPLAGYKVLDCSRLLPYQYCTLLLADLGAEVLKIEEPGRGDYGRWADLKTPGKEKLSFIMANRNKKSMTLNLRSPDGSIILKRLASKYDVLFETFRPGVMDRLELGYRTMREINPKIIYCSGTGYGQSGPYRSNAGHDINYLSIAGILGSTGIEKGRPPVPSVPFADMAGGGVFPCLTIIAALLGRERTGTGQYIDVAMTDVMTSFNIINIASALESPPLNAVPSYSVLSKCISYNVYKTKDGKYVSIGNVESKFWENFCQAIGREDLIKKQYSIYEDGEESTENLKKIFASKTQLEWIEFSNEVDHCLSPVKTPEETVRDPHLTERGIIAKVQDPKRGEMLQIAFPAIFSEKLDSGRSPAPMLGEHTTQTLEELGYRIDEIHALKKKGVI